ncbi:MAG: FkbM family methyltransferase [Balneolaceae bacterium]
MRFITDKIIDVTGRLLRKIPNVPGKHFYCKKLLKPVINRLDIEKTLEINSGSSKIICRLRDWIPWNIYLHGSYIVEEAYEKFMLSYCDQSKMIFDVGANIGYYTLQFAQKTDGHVYAFEPMYYQYNTLLKNIDINNLSNVYPIKQIVSDHAGKQRIYFSGMDNTAASSVVNQTDYYEDVPSVSLDKFCKEKNIEWIDLIKIDVEGYELHVLKGLSGMLESHKVKHLFIEIAEQHLQKAGDSSEELINYLKQFQYKGYSIKTGKPDEYELGNNESLVYFTDEIT